MDLKALIEKLKSPELVVLSDAAVVAALAVKNISQAREQVATWEIFEAINPAEYAALTAAYKDQLRTILSMGTVSVNGANTKTTLFAMFAAGSATRTALIDMAKTSVSWLEANGYPVLHAGDIAAVRAGGKI